MIDPQKLQKQIKSNVKTLLIILTAFATLTLVLSTVQTFRASEQRKDYERNLDSIYVYSGNIALKITYLFDLTKMCREFAKNPKSRLSPELREQFSFYIRKKVEARAAIEATAPKIRRRIGRKAYELANYFILITEDYSDSPDSYCQMKQYDWKILKKKQHEFTRLAKRNLKSLYTEEGL